MSRCLLHLSHLEDFKAWLDAQGVGHRPGRDFYQVLQVQVPGGWACIYQRNHMPEHYTVESRLEGLVRRFIKGRRG